MPRQPSSSETWHLLAGVGLGWLSALACVLVFPTQGDRGSIVWTLVLGFPFAALVVVPSLAWLHERWAEARAKPPSS